MHDMRKTEKLKETQVTLNLKSFKPSNLATTQLDLQWDKVSYAREFLHYKVHNTFSLMLSKVHPCFDMNVTNFIQFC